MNGHVTVHGGAFGTLLAILRLLAVFLFGARHVINNIAAGAVKG